MACRQLAGARLLRLEVAISAGSWRVWWSGAAWGELRLGSKGCFIPVLSKPPCQCFYTVVNNKKQFYSRIERWRLAWLGGLWGA